MEIEIEASGRWACIIKSMKMENERMSSDGWRTPAGRTDGEGQITRRLRNTEVKQEDQGVSSPGKLPQVLRSDQLVEDERPKPTRKSPSKFITDPSHIFRSRSHIK